MSYHHHYNLNDHTGQHLRDELAYVKTNVDYFANRWGANAEGRYKGWNFICMFFPYEWMAFRKMYVEALLSFAAVWVLSFCFQLLFSQTILYKVCIWGMRLAFGVLGNLLYWKKTQRMVGRAQGLGDEERYAYLQAKGGTGVLGLIAFIIFECVYYFAINYFFAEPVI